MVVRGNGSKLLTFSTRYTHHHPLSSMGVSLYVTPSGATGLCARRQTAVPSGLASATRGIQGQSAAAATQSLEWPIFGVIKTVDSHSAVITRMPRSKICISSSVRKPEASPCIIDPKSQNIASNASPASERRKARTGSADLPCGSG